MKQNKTDFKEFRIYYDGVIKYDARYPLIDSWINRVMKKWWNDYQKRKNKEGAEMIEEIIIDEVNVVGCKHYDFENNYCDQSYLGEGGLLKNTKNPKRCECSPNCYYKQLQRLKQENEKLKNKNIYRETCEYFKRICNENTLLIKYRSVLEEINLIIDELKQQYDYMEDYSEIKEIEKKINEVLNEDTEN